MMYTQLQALDSVRAASHGMKTSDNLGFARNEGLAPLAIGELTSASTYYAMAFAHRPGGGHQLVALLGLHGDDNLYMDDRNDWKRSYVPWHIRGYPFSLQVSGGDNGLRAVLCFDHQSGLYRESPEQDAGEVRFFDDLGRLRPWLERVMAFLKETTTNMLRTQAAVDALDRAGVLVPWELPVDRPEAGRTLHQGLLRIDESALNAVGGGGLEALHQHGALAIAYAQLLSMSRLDVLRGLYDRRSAQSTVGDCDLQSLLMQGQPETLRFDWGGD